MQFWQDKEVTVQETAAYNTDCDLQKGACEQTFKSGGKVRFSISPLPIKGVKPLTLKVKTEGIDANSVEVDFRSRVMDMGFNRPKLKKDTENHFSGPGMLSICVLKVMPWEAQVLIDTDKGTLLAPFRFNIESY